ncbi:MAG: GxxExxY protein [Bacteroidota bacterium]|nr:GxxExxY protein [Bacteroidota bacterium]MDP4230220.1 GxxExxY protein [Bacteroidota bacterium]
MGHDFKEKELTEKIIGCAMKIHRTMGNGFQEVVYQRCLEIEFRKNGIQHSREHEMPLRYEGENVGVRRVDFLVDNKIPVELKAITDLEDVHLAQGLNYLEAYNLEIGLLINFGARSLQVKRLLNRKFKPQYI